MSDECLHMIDTVKQIHSLIKLARFARQFLKGVYQFVFNKELKDEDKYQEVFKILKILE